MVTNKTIQDDPFRKISVRTSTHQRLKRDAKEFEEQIGYKVSIDSWIMEMYKIIGVYEEHQGIFKGKKQNV